MGYIWRTAFLDDYDEPYPEDSAGIEKINVSNEFLSIYHHDIEIKLVEVNHCLCPTPLLFLLLET
jgi:hypothetical protein